MRKARNLFELYDQIVSERARFFGIFFVVMLISYGFLVMIDFIPEPIEETEAITATEAEAKEEVVKEEPVKEEVKNVASPLPVSIHFDSLDRTIKVNNPTDDSIAALDAALLSGVIRHPDSADFKNTGNIFILGHSSYLPTVFNKNYQAFNDIQKLAWGDTIRLRSADTEYVYRVERVYEAKASQLVVPNGRGKATLTLATCDVYGAKEDRFIVEASLVSQKAI